MKKIKISYYTKQKKNYSFILGNGSKYTYTQEKECIAKLNQVNKDLTKLAFDININYIEAFSIWRLYWASVDYPAFERKTNEVNSNILQSLENAYIKRSDSYSIYVFMHLKNAINNTIQLIKLVLIEIRKKSDTVNLYRVESIVKRFIQLKTELENYGLMDCTEKIEIELQRIEQTLKIVS